MTHNTQHTLVALGGTGLIGKKLLSRIQGRAASPSNGVNAYTGEGLDAALAGTTTLIDVSNSPDFSDGPAMDFFRTTTTNTIAAARRAGITHYIALSVVGADRMTSSGYMRAKLAQEKLIAESGIPYTILRATQFFEFLPMIVGAYTSGDTIKVPAGPFQPVAADDVADALARIAFSAPANAIVELNGPERTNIAGAANQYLAAKNNPARATTDTTVNYFGADVTDGALVPTGPAWQGRISLQSWLMLS